MNILIQVCFQTVWVLQKLNSSQSQEVKSYSTLSVWLMINHSETRLAVNKQTVSAIHSTL